VSDEPDISVPPHLAGGAWANDVFVYGGLDEFTVDFVRLDPIDDAKGVLVARVAVSRACVLKLRRDLDIVWTEYVRATLPPEFQDERTEET
jgi:hypothetical protein